MAEFATLKLADIIVPPRLREVDEDQAQILSSQIAWQGLLNPITVRRTPPATKPYQPYTLIAGAHRRRAVELLNGTAIEAMIVEADAIDGMMLEVSENLIRNELTALERAVFVLAYREAWEKRYGQVKAGRPWQKNNRDNLSQLPTEGPVNIVEAVDGSNFYEVASARLGIHPKGIKRATRIATKIPAAIRGHLRGTEHADNQNFLLKLAGFGPERQAEISRALAQSPDIVRAIEVTDPAAQAKAQRNGQDLLLDRLISTWARASESTRAKFLGLLADAEKRKDARDGLPSVSELLAATGTPTIKDKLQ